ncbi:MAG: RNA polymerase factor sigma-32 [Candidatus Paracaedibacteraceae bacterium]|nr:RNA polymerase factor sigma-32 [Candidatus Paracaedibacteraceae bacterium]
MTYLNTLTYQSELAFIRNSMKLPLLDREEEYALTCSWYYKKDEKALKKLIASYGKLVISIAVRFKHYGLSLSDLIQEGNLGVLHAAQRFSPERDVRFATYAKWWVRAFIQDYILRNWSIVRTGSTTSQKMLFFNLKRLKSQLAHLSDDLMSHEQHHEISQILRVSMNDVAEMEQRLLHNDFSLSMTAVNSDEEWINLLKDERMNPEEENSFIENEQNYHIWIDQAMAVLNPREVYIILKRRLQDPQETLETIGNELGITKERVRQLEVRAVRKMKHFFVSHANEARKSINFLC